MDGYEHEVHATSCECIQEHLNMAQYGQTCHTLTVGLMQDYPVMSHYGCW